MVPVINYAKVLVNNLDNFGGPPEDLVTFCYQWIWQKMENKLQH